MTGNCLATFGGRSGPLLDRAVSFYPICRVIVSFYYNILVGKLIVIVNLN